MQLEPGHELGPYEIREQLGAGGMGEVWLAEDSRLGRTVAIKVLPPEFASDPERLARFEQEARAAAALNHPHIAVVHDIGAEDGLHYMVQEHLRGKTLREALEKGALPLGEALALATEIAEALNAAHKAGIVHRDLKPDNVFVSEDQHAKVLDFGLAKLTEVTPGQGGSASMSPTMLGTQTGVIMGTAGYMAPEQIQGEAVDGRTDLFAFGCLLYEMVSGTRAFSGQSLVQTLNRIAHEEPQQLSTFNAALPAELQRIVGKCLAKSPSRRYQAAADLTVDLQSLAGDVEAGKIAPAVVAGAPARGPGPGSWVAGVTVGFVVGATLVGASLWYATRPAPQLPTRLAVALTSPDYGIPGPPLIAISPNGRTVVYTGTDQLYRRDLEHLEADPIPGTEGGNTPFFSPDGRWLAFQTNSGLAKVSLSGGPAVPLCDEQIRGAHWGANDTIVAGSLTDGLLRISGSGGDCSSLTTRAEGVDGHWRPDILPDGRHVVFTVWTGSVGAAQLAVASMDSGEHRLLGVGGTYPRYVSPGFLVFAREGSLWAARFDAVGAVVLGEPVPVVDSVRVEPSGASQYDLADNGSLLYMPGGMSSGERQLAWVDREGNETILPAPVRVYRDPVISPDGGQIALTVDGEEADVYVWDVARENLTRLTFDGNNDHPLWSRDGSTITFRSDRDDGSVLRRAASGSGTTERLLTDRITPWSWSPDGDLVLHTGNGMAVRPATSDSAADVVLEFERDFPIEADRPTLSPDGGWIAYQAFQSTRPEIFVRPFPDVDQGLWQISSTGGAEPKWSADGRELFFRGPNSLMVAAIDTSSTFVASTPTLVFSTRGYYTGNAVRSYDVAPDGTRFLMITAAASAYESSLPGMILVQNWVEELERLVPETR